MQYAKKRTFGQKLIDIFSSVTSKRSISILSLLIIVAALPLTLFLVNDQTQYQEHAAAISSFVTRSGSQLLVEGHPFRFVGANIHYLGLIDATPPVYPTHSQIDRGFATANTMHATVVRSTTMGISVGCTTCIEPNLNIFNEAAFESIDYAIKVANSYNIRLIIPFAADGNLCYYDGCIQTFTNWEGFTNSSSIYQQVVDEFFGNSTVLQDYENYISHILNHVNQYTGVAYKNDPTIMIWETGNELWDPANCPVCWTARDNTWTETIASYIKSIAPNQLVEDGHYSNYQSDLSRDQLQLSAVDAYTSHYYHSMLGSTYIQRMQTSSSLAKKYNKVYYIGEFDWSSLSGTSSDLQNFLTAVENSSTNIDTFWQLYPQGMSGDEYSLVYSGQTTDLQQRQQILTQHAINMTYTNATPIPTTTPTPTLIST